MPHSSQETKGWLSKRHSVHMEIWEDGGHVVPNAGLRRLRSRQRQLPDTPEVGTVARLHSQCVLLIV